MRFENHIHAQDGTYSAVEMPGPRDLETWRACYHVYKAAAVMLKIAHPAVLERYEALFEQCCRRFPGAWHVLVLADMRCRSEFFGAEKRRLRELHYKCPALSDWVPDMPWNAVIRSACEDLTYWHRNVESPALDYTLGRGSKDTLRLTDFGTGAMSSGGTFSGQSSGKRQGKPDMLAGWNSHNSKGIEICRKWNQLPLRKFWAAVHQ